MIQTLIVLYHTKNHKSLQKVVVTQAQCPLRLD